MIGVSRGEAASYGEAGSYGMTASYGKATSYGKVASYAKAASKSEVRHYKMLRKPVMGRQPYMVNQALSVEASLSGKAVSYSEAPFCFKGCGDAFRISQPRLKKFWITSEFNSQRWGTKITSNLCLTSLTLVYFTFSFGIFLCLEEYLHKYTKTKTKFGTL